MTDLTKKGRTKVWSPDVWGAKEEEAFKRLKAAMLTAPVLQLPDFDREFVATSDASKVSVRAILQQNFGKGLQPICYDSRKLNPNNASIVVTNGSYWVLYRQWASGDIIWHGPTLQSKLTTTLSRTYPTNLLLIDRFGNGYKFCRVMIVT